MLGSPAVFWTDSTALRSQKSDAISHLDFSIVLFVSSLFCLPLFIFICVTYCSGVLIPISICLILWTHFLRSSSFLSHHQNLPQPEVVIPEHLPALLYAPSSITGGIPCPSASIFFSEKVFIFYAKNLWLQLHINLISPHGGMSKSIGIDSRVSIFLRSHLIG